MRVLLFTGKGGVGKTSAALATALCAARGGQRTLALSTDAAHSLGDALGRPVGPRPVEIEPQLFAQEVAPLAELDRSWAEIQEWLAALLLEDESPLAEELLVFPGFEELVALRAVGEAERSGRYDLCVVDCAPTASTLRMLRLPDLLRQAMEGLWGWKRRAARALRPLAEGLGAGHLIAPESVFDAVEQLAAEVEGVRQILLDESRTSARLVLNPARVVVEESRRAFAYLSLYGVATDCVVVNRLLPESAREGYFARWAERERTELAEIEKSFPVPRLCASLHAGELRGAEALAELGRELYAEGDPAARLSTRRPLRFERDEAGARLAIDLPTADPGQVDVRVRGDDLAVSVRDFERRVALPASWVGLRLESSGWRDGVFEVRFAPPTGAP